jgi:hypothetical protein
VKKLGSVGRKYIFFLNIFFMVLVVEKIIGSVEKNRVGREPEPQVFFFYA